MTLRTRHIVDFAAIAILVAAIDIVAKELAVTLLAGGPVTLDAIGRGLRFVLVHNDLSAYGISLGPLTRELNVAATSAAVILAVPACDRLRSIDPLAPVALGLIAGAALGNLFSMLTSTLGVVDFIALPIGTGGEIVFNLADVAAYLGLALLVRIVFSVWRLVRRERQQQADARA